MEATFVVKPNEVTPQVLERMIQVFADTEESVVITVKTIKKRPMSAQHDLFRQMEEVRLRTEKVPVPPNVDLNALIDEMNDTPL